MAKMIDLKYQTLMDLIWIIPDFFHFILPCLNNVCTIPNKIEVCTIWNIQDKTWSNLWENIELKLNDVICFSTIILYSCVLCYIWLTFDKTTSTRMDLIFLYFFHTQAVYIIPIHPHKCFLRFEALLIVHWLLMDLTQRLVTLLHLMLPSFRGF